MKPSDRRWLKEIPFGFTVEGPLNDAEDNAPYIVITGMIHGFPYEVGLTLNAKTTGTSTSFRDWMADHAVPQWKELIK